MLTRLLRGGVPHDGASPSLDAAADDAWFTAWRDRDLSRLAAAGAIYTDYTGAALYPDDCQELAALLDIADQAMYADKRVRQGERQGSDANGRRVPAVANAPNATPAASRPKNGRIGTGRNPFRRK